MSERFLEEAQRIINSAYEVPINVLVWGPGKADERGYAKRRQIKAEIEKRFPKSEVYLSEDKELRTVTGFLREPLIEEIVHAQAADIIIVLSTSGGTEAELDRLLQYDTIARKLWVLIPDRFSPLRGIVKEELRGIEVEFFSNAEFDDCTLASDKCVNKVLGCAVEKLASLF